MNKHKKIIFALIYTFALGLILIYPVSRIVKIEFPSDKPVEMKFKVVLRDPYDPMRGRYVVLNVEPDRIPASKVQGDIRWRDKAYLVLERDENGFCKPVRVTKDRSSIKDGEIFVRVKNVWQTYSQRNDKKEYNLQLPFNRFYLNEFKAPQLEKELQYVTKKFDMVLTVKFFRNGLWAVSNLEKREIQSNK